jgi:uncharacterized protein YjbJ (UPF0337 family)
MEVANEQARNKRNWNETAGKLKQQFTNLTDDDLLYKEGKKEELLGRLQKKLGKSNEEIHKLVNYEKDIHHSGSIGFSCYYCHDRCPVYCQTTTGKACKKGSQ